MTDPWEPGFIASPQSDGRRLHALPCGSLAGPDHGGLTAGEMPDDQQITDSNARAAEQRHMLAYSPLDRMEGSGL